MHPLPRSRERAGGREAPTLRENLRRRGLDGTTLLALPALLCITLLFVYPFLYGLWLSFHPKLGGLFANYQKFFADPFLSDTIGTTLLIAVPVTLFNVALSVPVALRVRRLRRQRLLTTILVIPITLGTVLVAEGLLNYLGPRGWLNRVLLATGLSDAPIRLVHNYWGVALSLVITGFPFTFLLILSYVTGIDPSLEAAGAMLGARARARFRTILLPLLVPGLTITLCLAFVQAFSVFPSAVLLGAPAGPTRVISIAAYQAAFRAIRLLDGVGDRDDHGGRAGQHRGRAARRARPRLSRPGRRRKGLMLTEERTAGARLWSLLVWALVAFFVVNLLAMIATVLVNSFSTRWFTTWLPVGWTASWYALAWDEFQLPDILIATVEVVGAVVILSGLLGVPAAYAMARRDFQGKRALMLLFLLPLLVPPITYGIPLATVLYQAHLAGTIWGVILANLVPTVPFVILVMIPFVEQVDPRVEAAARVFGAGTFRLFSSVLLPLLAPGILAALLLVLVRTIAMFELTFLTSGADSQTLVVALYYAVFAAGVRPGQSIDAMAVVYMATTLAWLLVALRFVDPAQIVTRGKRA